MDQRKHTILHQKNMQHLNVLMLRGQWKRHAMNCQLWAGIIVYVPVNPQMSHTDFPGLCNMQYSFDAFSERIHFWCHLVGFHGATNGFILFYILFLFTESKPIGNVNISTRGVLDLSMCRTCPPVVQYYVLSNIAKDMNSLLQLPTFYNSTIS